MSDTNRSKDLFLDALERPAGERAAFLDGACAGDQELRARVDRLIAAHVHAEEMLATGLALATPAADGSRAEVDLGPGDRIGPYLLEEEIGAGGFGVVFRAIQEEPVRRTVALKVVKLGMDTKSVIARFELERQALALMEHPNIARVFDAGATESGRPYFAMELVEGVPITDYCDSERLGIDERVELFARVARAVQHAHQRGVLHRDIKPSNVLVTEVDGVAQPKVIDFGIAKATGEQLTEASLQTREGFLLGTPTYMSPEQVEGALDIDTRADVYSLGVLLYELVSGVTPFDTESMGLVAVFQSIRELDPPRPSTRRREVLESGEATAEQKRNLLDVPAELDWVVMRCLEKERDRRYSTAHDLAADAERFLRNEPLEAAPPSGWYRVRKLVRRHRTAAIAVVGIAAALVAGLIGTAFGLVRAERSNVKLDAALVEAREANTRLDVALVAMEEANTELDRSLGETEAANQKLDLALVEARRQTAIAEAVNAFLIQDLLGAARPTGEAGKGPATSIGELLGIAAAELDTASRPGGRFAGEPLVEASLRYTIGMAYDTLGEPAEASRHMRRCVELREEVLGPENTERLMALSNLAMYRRLEGAIAESSELQTEAFELLRETLGLHHEETLASAARLATVDRDLGRTDEALELLTIVMPVARASLGDLHPVTTDLGAALAILFADKGRYAEAEELFRLVLEAQLEILGPESPVVLNSKMNLATLNRALLRYEESEALYREVLETQRRVEGPEHPHTLSTLFNLVECLRSVERLDEASEILSESIPVAERVYGPEHRRTLLWLTTQARLLGQLERYTEAEQVHRDVYERSDAAYGPGDRATLDAATDLAKILMLDPEFWEESRELLHYVHETTVRTHGSEDPAALYARMHLGAFHATVGELEEARVELEETHAALLAALGPAHWMTVDAAKALAACQARSESAAVR